MTAIHSGGYIPLKVTLVSEGAFGDKTMVHPSTKNSKANVKSQIRWCLNLRHHLNIAVFFCETLRAKASMELFPDFQLSICMHCPGQILIH